MVRDGIWITGGTVFDGTDRPGFLADILIDRGEIADVRPIGEDALPPSERSPYHPVIDARGKVVTPGFIDMHSHSDLALFRPEGVGVKLRQGVTTEVLGQDGLSVAPVPPNQQREWQTRLAGLLGELPLPWAWSTIPEYLEAVAALPPEVNVAYLVPHGPLRGTALGTDAVLSNPAADEQMGRAIASGMDAGAFGLSFGLIYPPSAYANTEELTALARSTAANDGFVVVHMRNESSNVLAAFDEMRQVAKASGCPVHISHLKVAGKPNRPLWPALLDAIDRARSDGLDITFDQYPYAAGSTVLDALLPGWAHAGGSEALLGRLADPDHRRKMKRAMLGDEGPSIWEERGGPSAVMIAWVRSAANADVIGKTLEEIADQRGEDPLDVLMALVLEERGAATMVSFWGEDADIIPAMGHAAGMFCSDGIYGPHPHPRLSGAFPRVFGEFVRRQRTLSWPEAVAKMTSVPAKRLQLSRRGRIKKGWAADLVVMDPTRIDSLATYASPLVPPKGVEWVLVNGTIAVARGERTDARSGQVLRHRSGRVYRAR